MKPIKVIAVTVLAGTISIGAAIFGQRWVGESPLLERLSEHTPGELDTLPDFRLTALSGREVASNAWAGKVLVLNFWATWCPPCIEEMKTFILAQAALRENGVQFVGIAVDRPEDVQTFISTHPVDYPILIADAQVVELAQRLGNRLDVLPFTVIFDRRGRRIHSQMGPLSTEELRAELEPLLRDRTKL